MAALPSVLQSAYTAVRRAAGTEAMGPASVIEAYDLHDVLACGLAGGSFSMAHPDVPDGHLVCCRHGVPHVCGYGSRLAHTAVGLEDALIRMRTNDVVCRISGLVVTSLASLEPDREEADR